MINNWKVQQTRDWNLEYFVLWSIGSGNFLSWSNIRGTIVWCLALGLAAIMWHSGGMGSHGGGWMKLMGMVHRDRRSAQRHVQDAATALLAPIDRNEIFNSSSSSASPSSQFFAEKNCKAFCIKFLSFRYINNNLQIFVILLKNEL
ncbi:hypothetical protein QTP88_015828 [Uroleucon formosanum]